MEGNLFLLLCVMGTLVSFLILAFTKSVFWLFFSRIFDGLIGGNISLAKSYIADVTDEKERSEKMGIIGASFGIGFIIGPAIGGTLVKYNPQYPSLLAALLSAINLVGVMFMKESLDIKLRRDRIGSIFMEVFSDLKTLFTKWQIKNDFDASFPLSYCIYDI